MVSSAHIPVDVDSGMTSGKSLMKSKKSIGPKMLPCGTPEVTGDHDEADPLQQLAAYGYADSQRTICKDFLRYYNVSAFLTEWQDPLSRRL